FGSDARADGRTRRAGSGARWTDRPRARRRSRDHRRDDALARRRSGAGDATGRLSGARASARRARQLPGNGELGVGRRRYRTMVENAIHHVVVRDEPGAAHMADGYARASGKVGVALATSGPGATNLVTGIATAMLDSSPVVCITGQVPSKLLGSDAFQETDITGVTLPITKHNFLVTRVDEIGPTLRQAF